MSRRLALVIGNTEYTDPGLAALTTPSADAGDLAAVLADPRIGGFEVTTLLNETVQNVGLAVSRIFSQRDSEDFVVLYFSGHGIKDEDGALYLAVKDTQRSYPRVTAIAGAFLSSEMNRTRARRTLLILDSCYSGAFLQGAKGAGIGASAGTGEAFEGTGYGRVVLTATDSMQYAWEGDQLRGEATNSVFTTHLIRGLETGDADTDKNGWVTFDELFNYVYREVVTSTPKQTPQKWTFKMEADLQIARNPRLPDKHIVLPAHFSTAEHRRLQAHKEGKADWKLWGPYLSEREWGTVREDYSPDGTVWDYFPFDHSRSRAYRWGEDGIAGFCDANQYLCCSLAFWNGLDPILKDRLFGLTSPEGNHGEDVKECYYYVDDTPTHSYTKVLYKYPQRAFPYQAIFDENRRRSAAEREFELVGTGIFDDARYFDVTAEYAKATETDILIRITVANRGPAAAACYVLPTLCFRNTWSWGYPAGPRDDVPGRPLLRRFPDTNGVPTLEASHPTLGPYQLYAEDAADAWFTENETNFTRLFGVDNRSAYVKDAFHRHLVDGEDEAINPDGTGTKATVVYPVTVDAGESRTIRLRLTNIPNATPFTDFDEQVKARVDEADAYYAALQRPTASEDARLVQRQALAGLLTSQQFVYYDVEQWWSGDPAVPVPANTRKGGRNSSWWHVSFADVISIPDKWEYPYFNGWELALQSVPLALVDVDFAKRQIELMTSDAYMHANGQLPTYEWSLGDVSPPVHAWAARKVYEHELLATGNGDRLFLERVFLRLLQNFTWWVNRKDWSGNNVFEGGTLGLDNIGIFDRSMPLATGFRVEALDGSAWMGSYCLNMVAIALELAKTSPAYVSLASRCLEHFLSVTHVMNDRGFGDVPSWCEEDGFYYPLVRTDSGLLVPLRLRSMSGLVPLFGVEVIDAPEDELLLELDKRIAGFTRRKPQFGQYVSTKSQTGRGRARLLSMVSASRLKRILSRMLDEAEFLAPGGVRSLSRVYADNPYTLKLNGAEYRIAYEPGESRTTLFGGNQNWRGPVWIPMNYLIIDALLKYHRYYGDELTVEFPTGSGRLLNLKDVAKELATRIIGLFVRGDDGKRPALGPDERAQRDPAWKDYVLFHEYFDGDSGEGLGASHQTGWSALVANLIQAEW